MIPDLAWYWWLLITLLASVFVVAIVLTLGDAGDSHKTKAMRDHEDGK